MKYVNQVIFVQDYDDDFAQDKYEKIAPQTT